VLRRVAAARLIPACERCDVRFAPCKLIKQKSNSAETIIKLVSRPPMMCAGSGRFLIKYYIRCSCIICSGISHRRSEFQQRDSEFIAHNSIGCIMRGRYRQMPLKRSFSNIFILIETSLYIQLKKLCAGKLS
jgi:hypothetical protein